MQERFGGLLKQLGLPVDGIGNSRTIRRFHFFLMAPFLDALFGLRWIICSKLSEEKKSRVCKMIKTFVASAALQLRGSDRSDKMKSALETYVVVTTNGSINTLKRKTLFVFPKDDEWLPKRTRTNILERIVEVLLFSREELLSEYYQLVVL